MFNINNQETVSSIHSRIIRRHEREVVKTLRGLDKLTRKVACWKNHRHFNTHCLHDNIIPKSLQLRSTVKGIKASTTLRKAEKKLLNIRISQCHFTVNKLQDEKELLEANLRTKLIETEMEEVTAFIEHAHETTFRATRERQQRKYDQLLSKQQGSHGADSPQLDDPDNITERWVINLANRHLDSDEVGLLKKGLSFAVTPQSLPIDDLITATELDLTRFAIQAKGPDGKWTRKPLAYRESNNVHLLITRPPEICVNLVFKHIHAASENECFLMSNLD